MSELSRTISTGTSQVADAMRGLATIKGENRLRATRARAELGESMQRVAADLRAHKNFEEARKAEDEMVAIENADKLAMGDPEKRAIALDATQARTYKAATLLQAKKREVNKDLYEDRDYRLKRAQYFATEQNRLEAQDRQARVDELAFKKYEESRRADFDKQLTDYEEFQLKKQERERAQTETERHNKAMEGKENASPSGPDQPIPDQARVLLEKKAGLDSGALSGMTFRDWSAIEQNPQDEILKQLRVIAAQRETNDYEPPAVKDARKAFEKADAEYQDALKPGSMTQNPSDVEAYREMRKKKLEAAEAKFIEAPKAAKAEGAPKDIGAEVTDKDGIRWTWNARSGVYEKAR